LSTVFLKIYKKFSMALLAPKANQSIRRVPLLKLYILMLVLKIGTLTRKAVFRQKNKKARRCVSEEPFVLRARMTLDVTVAFQGFIHLCGFRL
jgi:uncharacterized membrane protein YsdA (DUF1294 family)